MIIRILLLVFLIRLLIMTEEPFLCSGIYTAVVFVFGLILGQPLGGIIINCIIVMALASLYFWLLDYFSESGMLWWLIMIFGLVIGLV